MFRYFKRAARAVAHLNAPRCACTCHMSFTMALTAFCACKMQFFAFCYSADAKYTNTCRRCEMAISCTGRVRRRGAEGEVRRCGVGDVRGGAPLVARRPRLGRGGRSHKQSLPKSTTSLSPGRRGGATAQTRARPRLVQTQCWCPRDVGSAVAVYVWLTYFSSVQFKRVRVAPSAGFP